MKLRSVDMDDEENPKALTVTMTVEEAALIYAYTGRVAPLFVTEAAGDQKWGEASDEIAECLSAAFFNRFYDSGATEVLDLTMEQVMAAKKQHHEWKH